MIVDHHGRGHHDIVLHFRTWKTVMTMYGVHDKRCWNMHSRKYVCDDDDDDQHHDDEDDGDDHYRDEWKAYEKQRQQHLDQSVIYHMLWDGVEV